jgi:predicted nucleic acid-binding protein
MSRIFWDTNLFIYLLEGRGSAWDRTVALRKALLVRGDQLLTSTLTLGEVLVRPIECGESELCRKYESAIAETSLLVPFDTKAARRYAALRCDLFITNDTRLQNKKVEGIEFIVPLARAPL